MLKKGFSFNSSLVLYNDLSSITCSGLLRLNSSAETVHMGKETRLTRTPLTHTHSHSLETRKDVNLAIQSLFIG